MSEITAIILAGGTAPRMRPLSLDKPKSMISFIGKPLLSFLITSLKLNNLLEILINTSFEQGEAREYFSTGSILVLISSIMKVKNGMELLELQKIS